MLSFFRNMFSSKLGLLLTFGFLGLIALAFATADVSGSGTFGGITSGSYVSNIGGEKIGTAEFSQAATNAYNAERQRNPGLALKDFASDETMNAIIGQMETSYLMSVFAEDVGMAAGKRLVDSEIRSIGAFNGPDGNFSEQTFRQALAQQRISERQLRDDMARSLLARQVLTPVGYGATVGKEIAMPYVSLLLERRQGQIGVIPSAVYAPSKDPSETALKSFYTATSSRYTIPETRSMRYVVVTPSNMKSIPAPTEEAVRAAYEDRADEFAAKEERAFTQVIAPTEAAAKALLAAAEKNGIDAAASGVGLEASKLALQSKQALSASSSSEVANAAFAAAQGRYAAIRKGGLGWYVLRVDEVKQTPAKSLAEVRGQLEDELSKELRLQAFSDLGANAEDQIDDGASLKEIADGLGLKVLSTPLLLQDGRAPKQADFQASEDVTALLSGLFAFEETSEPQLAPLSQGQAFAIYEAAEIVEAAPPPLAQIKARVVADWKLAQGSKAAKAAADKALAKIAKGGTMASALKELGKPLPPIDEISASREEITQAGEGVPPPLALLFSMAEKSVKRLEAPNNAGWFVIYLNDIIPGNPNDNAEILASFRAQMRDVVSRELQAQFARALRSEINVNRNPKAIATVQRQITGQN